MGDYKTEAMMAADGELHLHHVPFEAGERVEVIVTRVSQRSLGDENLSLGLQATLLAEATLMRIWNSPEEDEAWRDL
ncbi:MAG: DUF2281 domain-containing protein [Microbacteriaceae bacterium]|nr:DUF2281 domain-containing protein [Microbacteriaceae bacterium]